MIRSEAEKGTRLFDSIVYSFDNLGRLTQVVQRQFTSGEQTSYGATSTNTFTRKRANLAYNAAGQFSKIARSAWIGSGDTEVATSVYSDFNGGAAKQIANWHSGLTSASTAPTSLGSSISSYSWTYDTHGRAASFTAPEGTFAYGYDITHELISATFTVASGYTGGTPATETFSFDNTGNRTGSGISVEKNRLLSDGTYNYTYDGEGNRTVRTEIATGQTLIYSWDHRNRLTKVESRNSVNGSATKIVVNTYDAFDRRVMKQVDDNANGTFDRTERYVWDGDQISLVLDAYGAVLHRFLHGPAIDQIFADESSVDGLLWDLGDNQNTTRDVINNSGTVVNHLTYSPFGVIASESNAAKTPFAAYTGRDWDEDLQLQYNRGCWYEPSTGRWLSEDPIWFGAGDTNLQRYVGNVPTNATDPSGLDPEYGTQEWFIWFAQKDNSYNSVLKYADWLAADARLRAEGTRTYLNFLERALAEEINFESIDERRNLFQRIRRENAAQSAGQPSICAVAGSTERRGQMQRDWENNQIAHGDGPIARALMNFFTPSTVNPNALTLDNIVELAPFAVLRASQLNGQPRLRSFAPQPGERGFIGPLPWKRNGAFDAHWPKEDGFLMEGVRTRPARIKVVDR